MPNSSLDQLKFTKPESFVYGGVGAARIVWLRQRNRMDAKAQALYHHMQEQGLFLSVADIFEISSTDISRADLVLLDAFGSVDGSIETVVARIRFESKVPLIMLTDGSSIEQLVTALTAGADAIWSLNTPVEVLLARCKALLRRWLPASR